MLSINTVDDRIDRVRIPGSDDLRAVVELRVLVD